MKHISGIIRRPLRLLASVAVICALYSLVGFVVLPFVLRRQIASRASEALNRTVTVKEVRVNPWTFHLVIRGLDVAAAGGGDFAGWDELGVRFLPVASARERSWTFEEIRLLRPHGGLVRDAAGKLSIEDMMTTSELSPTPSPKAEAQASQPQSLTIRRLHVEGGEFVFEDHFKSVPFATKVGPVSFELVDFTTRPNQAGTCTFAAVTEAGERLSWQGKLAFNPMGSMGHVVIENVRVRKYLKYHRDHHRLDILDGRLSLDFDYEVAAGETDTDFRVHAGRLGIDQLALAGRGTDTAIATIPRLEVNGIEYDAGAAKMSVAEVLLRGASISARRRADGTIDWSELLKPEIVALADAVPAVLEVTGGGAQTTPFVATIGRLAVENATLRLDDFAAAQPVSIVCDQLSLALLNLDTRLDRPVDLSLSCMVNGDGRLSLAGKVTPQPLGAEVQLDADAISLRPFDSYLSPFLNLHLASGAVRAHGRATVVSGADGRPAPTWNGELGVSGLSLLDGSLTEQLIGFSDLALHRVSAKTSPLALEVGEVALMQPYVRLVVEKDRQFNLAGLVKPQPKPAAVEEPKKDASTAAPAIPIKIGRVTVSGGRIRATDRTVSPEFNVALADFGGSITGLTSEQLARADIDLSGRIGVAPLRVTGSINPPSSGTATDLKVVLGGLEMPILSSYSGRYAGYSIEKGKLGVDISCRISARELVADNRVVLDQFYLGQEVESPDSIGLPLKLALSILRDRDGRISAEVPVRGSLDDPNFRYGKVLWGAVRNIIVKAVTAPFTVLGDLFGGGHDLSAVDFVSGSASVDAEARARLDGLARTLAERPGLSLEISSLPQPEQDTVGLRAAQLDTMMRSRKLREMQAEKPGAEIDPTKIVLTLDEQTRYLADLYAERCKSGVVAGAQADAVDIPASTPAVRRPNLVFRTARRIWDLRHGWGRRADSGTVAASHGRMSAKQPPADAGGAADLSAEEKRIRVLETIRPAESDYALLAAKRAARIQRYLVEQGKVDPTRVFLVTSGLPPSAPIPRVVFNIK